MGSSEQKPALLRDYERFSKDRVERILDEWQWDRDGRELVRMNGKKCGGRQGWMISHQWERATIDKALRKVRPVLIFENSTWKTGPLTHWPKSDEQKSGEAATE